MLDGNELKFGDLLVEKGKECNSLFMFLEYRSATMNIKLLKIPNDVYIPSVPVWKPDYESFLDSRYVRDHGFFRPIFNMIYASTDEIEWHNYKANHYLNLGKWLYDCSLYPIGKTYLDFKNGDHIKIKSIDEWSDSDSAKEDAEKFFIFNNLTACLMQGRSCGKTFFALHQMKEYLKDHPDAKIVMPYHNGYSYYKELINSVYGYKKPPYDDVPHDAVRYAVEEFERKQREERLEKAKLTNEELKRMLNNSHYGVCWPSGLVNWDTSERIDKYRKEEEEMYRTFICSDVVLTADLYLEGRVPNYDKKISATVYAYDDCSGFDIYLRFHAGRGWCFVVHIGDMDVTAAYYAGTALFNFIYNRVYDQTNRQIRICDTPINLSNIRHIVEEYDLFKTRKAKDSTKKETTEMKGYKFMVPKGVFGSRVYIQDKNSDAITYAGTLTDMHLETASGCEMHGNIDFIADGEPIERFANLNRGFIKNVVFHDPATIVEWADGSKTVVQVRDGEKFDPEKGLAMAIAKKAMGNKRDYYHVFKHYLKKVKTESVCGEKLKTITLPEEKEGK